MDIDEIGNESVVETIQKNEINHLGINKVKEPNAIFTNKVTSPNVITLTMQIEDTGYQKEYIFTKQKGKWFLISIKDLSD